MKEAAELSLITEVKKIVEEISVLGPESKPLVTHIQGMIDSYDTDELADFLENHFEQR